MERLGNRANNEIRPVKITTNFTKYAAGSVLIEIILQNTQQVLYLSKWEKLR